MSDEQAPGEPVATTRSYRPGEWFGVLGQHVTVLLPPTEKARVAALWELVDDGAGFDEVLDALLADGLRRLPGFVLVATDGENTRVVLRGEARASLSTSTETVELDGAAASTWVERSLVGVSAMTLDVAATDGPDLTVDGGLVRVSRLDQPPHVAAAHVAAAPVAAAPEPPTLLPPEDHDGMTRAGVSGQPSAPVITSRPVALLVVSSGETVEVDRAVLVGRAPEARRFSPEEQPRLVTVLSPQHEISSTHVEIRPGAGADHGSAVVTDLGSTNGTVLEQPGLGTEDLQPGIPVQLLPGAVIDLGDGVTIRVTNP